MHCKSYSHFFSKKIQYICISLDVNFNESLTNDIISFEQLGPVLEEWVFSIKDFTHVSAVTYVVGVVLKVWWEFSSWLLTLSLLVATFVICWYPLQTVWTQIRPNKMLCLIIQMFGLIIKMLGLIWIQTVWHSDAIPERYFWKKLIKKKKKEIQTERSMQNQGSFSGTISWYSHIFIPRHTIVAGYYGFMLVVRESVHLSVRLFLFPDDNLSKHQWIFTKFGMCIDIVEIWFGIANGQILSIFDGVICPRHTLIFVSGL